MTLLRRCVVLSLGVAWAAAAVASEGAPVSMFNGTDLTGWDFDPLFWSVQEGAIVGACTPEKQPKHNTFCIWKGGTPGDFELTAKFKIDGGNSGIQFRSKTKPEWVVTGYQADMSGDGKWTGANYEEKGRGLIAKCGENVAIDAAGKRTVVGTVGDAKKILGKITTNDWNEYHVTAIGHHVVQQINGVTTCEFTDDQPGKLALDGVIALQMHAGFKQFTVQFKNMTLKTLTQTEAPAQSPAKTEK